MVVRRQIGLRSTERQDVSEDLQPLEQVLGMLLIIRDSCRCLDPTEGRVPGTEGFLDRTKHTVSPSYSPTVARECLHIKCTVGLYDGNPNDLHSVDELKDYVDI